MSNGYLKKKKNQSYRQIATHTHTHTNVCREKERESLSQSLQVYLVGVWSKVRSLSAPTPSLNYFVKIISRMKYNLT